MKILGIDPGIGRAGWGVIEVQSAKYTVRNFGCIETSKDELIEKRLRTLYMALVEIINTEKPDAVAVEDLFFSTNAKTAMIVGQARGVILLAAAQQDIPLTAYTPLQVKSAVTGFGHAEKKQVEKMTMLQLQMTKKPKLDDTTDALAIALTHAFSYQLEKAKGRSH
ncbi:MAG: hypothetical protein RLZZ455_293 [Candidatus Parcubacteria bacterium]